MIAVLPFWVSGAVLAGLGFFLLTLVQPLAGLSLVLIIGPFGALESIHFGPSLPKSGQLLFIFVVGAWLGYGILRHRINIPRTPVNLPLIVFIGAAAFSLLDTTSLWTGFKEIVKWIGLGAAMVMVADLGTSWRPLEVKERLGYQEQKTGINLRWLIAILLVAGVSQALIGIWQFGLRGEGPDHFMILDRFFRAFGTFQQPNPFGGYMGITAALALGTTLGAVMDWFKKAKVGKSWHLSDWFWLLFLLACSLILTLALLMSWSRGAWIGFAAAIVVLALFFPKRRWVGFFIMLVGCLIFLFLYQSNLFPEAVTGRLSDFASDLSIGDVRGVHITEENYSVIERLAHWQSGVGMAQDNFWLGVGFGNYEPAYADYALLNWPHPLGHAHNYYLNILAETGIIGSIAYLILWAVIFLQLIRLLRRLSWPERGIALGLLAAWTALSVHHLFDKLYVNNLYLFMGVMLGLQQVLALNYDHADS
ncbi:MAG: O-antigen ligase family protein [Chloroflexota bacterium]